MTCKCIETVNEKLAARNTRLMLPLVMGRGSDDPDRVMIITEQIEKGRGKEKGVGMFASYCPFCGARYEADRVPEPKAIKLTPFHFDVLQALFESDAQERYEQLSNIGVYLERSKNDVRLACRSLKRKGLAKQVAWHDDDGFICGSGYAITAKGIEHVKKIKEKV